jgi:hypothetical protein
MPPPPPHWTFPDEPPDAPPGEWAACVTNVVKGGEYTPEADGPRAYAVKMAPRLYVHWAFRVRHYVLRTDRTTILRRPLASRTAGEPAGPVFSSTGRPTC